jgi:hypothetical protein
MTDLERCGAQLAAAKRAVVRVRSALHATEDALQGRGDPSAFLLWPVVRIALETRAELSRLQAELKLHQARNGHEGAA